MLALLLALGLAQPPAGPAAEVRAVLDAQQAAWNAGKLGEFVSHYAADATFYSGGTVTRGRDAVLARYRKRYQADGKEMGRLAFSDLEIEPLSPTAAVVRGRYRVVTKAGAATGLFTLICKKGDAWRVAHDHTSAAD